MTTLVSEQLLRIMGDVDRLVSATVDPVLKEAGLAREQWQLLRLLADGHGRRMGWITEQLGLPAPTVTRAVDGLVARTLVYRRGDPLDRRRVLVFLGEPGRQVLEQVIAGFDERAQGSFDGLSADDRERLVDTLQRLLAVASSPAADETTAAAPRSHGSG
jgi:DNA-binding MarR family transcriptional regulator